MASKISQYFSVNNIGAYDFRMLEMIQERGTLGPEVKNKIASRNKSGDLKIMEIPTHEKSNRTSSRSIHNWSRCSRRDRW